MLIRYFFSLSTSLSSSSTICNDETLELKTKLLLFAKKKNNALRVISIQNPCEPFYIERNECQFLDMFYCFIAPIIEDLIVMGSKYS